jgi:hypothetical protein
MKSRLPVLLLAISVVLFATNAGWYWAKVVRSKQQAQPTAQQVQKAEKPSEPAKESAAEPLPSETKWGKLFSRRPVPAKEVK